MQLTTIKEEESLNTMDKYSEDYIYTVGNLFYQILRWDYINEDQLNLTNPDIRLGYNCWKLACRHASTTHEIEYEWMIKYLQEKDPSEPILACSFWAIFMCRPIYSIMLDRNHIMQFYNRVFAPHMNKIMDTTIAVFESDPISVCDLIRQDKIEHAYPIMHAFRRYLDNPNDEYWKVNLRKLKDDNDSRHYDLGKGSLYGEKEKSVYFLHSDLIIRLIDRHRSYLSTHLEWPSWIANQFGRMAYLTKGHLNHETMVNQVKELVSIWKDLIGDECFPPKRASLAECNDNCVKLMHKHKELSPSAQFFKQRIFRGFCKEISCFFDHCPYNTVSELQWEQIQWQIVVQIIGEDPLPYGIYRLENLASLVCSYRPNCKTISLNRMQENQLKPMKWILSQLPNLNLSKLWAYLNVGNSVTKAHIAFVFHHLGMTHPADSVNNNYVIDIVKCRQGVSWTNDMQLRRIRQYPKLQWCVETHNQKLSLMRMCAKIITQNLHNTNIYGLNNLLPEPILMYLRGQFVTDRC